jgi:hypothetical protein
MAHNRLGVEQVDRKLDENRPLHALARCGESLFNHRADVPDAPDLPEKLHMSEATGR